MNTTKIIKKLILEIIFFAGFGLLVLFFFQNAEAQEATYYVDQNHALASDSNPGTQGLPWSTIQHAADVAEPGYNIIVMSGDYERTTINTSGTDNSMIVFKGNTVPQINFPDGSNAHLENPDQVIKTQGFYISGNYISIQNFEITEISPYRGAFYLNDAEHVEIIGNYIHELNPDLYDGGGVRGKGNYILVRDNILWRVQSIGVTCSGYNWLVQGNNISHGTDRRSDGTSVGTDVDAIRFFGRGHIIRNNYLHDYLNEECVGSPHMDAFQTFSVYPESQWADHILIEGNYCYNFGQMLMSEDQAEVNTGQNCVHHIIFRNNVFKWSRAVSIIVSDRVDYFSFINNVVNDAYYTSISISDNSHHAIVVNNIFYMNYRNDPENRRGQMLTDSLSKIGSVWDYNIHEPDFTWPIKQPEFDTHGMYGIDPEFVSPESGDFHLMGSSPAIDAGIDMGRLQSELENQGQVEQAATIAEYISDLEEYFDAVIDKDKNGVLRPQGIAWDIGAYEYVQDTGDNGYIVVVYPNPCRVFRGENFITFSGNINSEDVIKIYDISGRLVNKSGDFFQAAYPYRWYTNDVSSGIYFYVIKSADGQRQTSGKIAVIR